MHELCVHTVSSQGQGKTNPDLSGAASMCLWCLAALKICDDDDDKWSIKLLPFFTTYLSEQLNTLSGTKYQYLLEFPVTVSI